MPQLSDEALRSASLDCFAVEVETPETAAPEAIEKPKAKRKRRSKEELRQADINALIAREHELDGKSKTLNIERCFLTDLRVSSEVWEELRARTVDSLEQLARSAEGKAQREGRKTILIQDII